MNKLPTPQPLRRAHLANYLRDLVNDVAAQGKIAKIKGNPVEVAAVALLSGSVAVVQTMWEDIASLTGDASTHAKSLARPVLESVISHGAHAIVDKLLGPRK